MTDERISAERARFRRVQELFHQAAELAPAERRSWLEARGLLTAGSAVDAESFLRARELRDLLRALARRNVRADEPVDPALRERFAGAVREARLGVAIDEGGSLRLVGAQDGVDGALAVILARAVEAQATGAWARMKSCPGAHCGWLFYDTSRNRSRRWCNMDGCGNRAKARRYYERQRTTRMAGTGSGPDCSTDV